MKTPLTCEEAREARLDRASGPLDAERERALAEHTDGCDECRRFAGEIDALEAGLEDTLGAAASVAVARRFRPRSRWAGPAVAAGLLLAAGAGFLVAGGRSPAASGRTLGGAVALERGAEITVEVREDPLKRSHGAVGASVLAVGVVSGAVLLKMEDGQEAALHQGETAFAQARAPIVVLDPAEEAAKQAAAEKKIAALETALARAEARASDLEKKLGAAAAPVAPPAKTGAPPAGSGSGVVAAAPETADEKVKDLVKKFDWKTGTEALVVYQRALQKGDTSKIEPGTYLQLSKMNVLVSEVAKARGLDNPWQAYQDPDVREAFYPSWLNALGAGLDDAQTAALKQHVRDDARNTTNSTAAPGTFLGTLAKELDDKLAEERYLGNLLQPAQMQRYYDAVGDDALLGAHVDRNTSRCSSPDALADCILGEWKKSFDLSPQSLGAAQALAAKYAQEAAAIPLVDPGLEGGARRVAATRRTIAVVALQERMEGELAALSVLTDAERARVHDGAHLVHDFQIKK